MSSEPRDNRPPEMPAVKTTIVGGRPPGPGTPIGQIPRGLEILIKKAAADPEFQALLLEKRAGAAAEIEGLTLDPAEAAMLNTIPAGQLRAIITQTSMSEETRRSLLGRVTYTAAVAALGLVVVGGILLPSLQSAGCRARPTQTAGIRPVIPPSRDESDRPPLTKGIQPDRPPVPPDSEVPNSETTLGIQPDVPAPTGIRPDRPPTPTSEPSKPPPLSRGIGFDRPPGSRRR